MCKTIDFTYKSATCQIIDWEDGTATLSALYSDIRRKGHAKNLLSEVIRWADKRKLTLVLEAEAYGSEPKMTASQLMKFYEKFGFVPPKVVTEHIRMTRKSE